MASASTVPAAATTTPAPGRPPRTLAASLVLTTLAAALFLAGMIIELAGGASVTVVGWPVVWAAAMTFYAAMAHAGRHWGRVMLGVLTALTGLLFTQLVITEPGILDPVSRPEHVVVITSAAAALQTLGFLAAFLPSANAFVAANRERVRCMPHRLRKVVLTVHIIASVAWLGVITVPSTVAFLLRTTDDAETMLGLYRTQLTLEELFLGKAAFLALFSGLALALGTKWRLVQHRWVLTKLVLTVAVMILPVAFYNRLNRQAYGMLEAGRSAAEVHDAVGFFGGLLPALHLSPLMLILATVLSVYKPWRR